MDGRVKNPTLSAFAVYFTQYAEKIDNQWRYRFVEHPLFSSYLMDMKRRHMMIYKRNWWITHTPGIADMTLDELKNIAFQDNSSQLWNGLRRSTINIKGSAADMYQNKLKVKEILSRQGCAIIWATRSYADQWQPQIKKILFPDGNVPESTWLVKKKSH